jgi:hypothetical protein
MGGYYKKRVQSLVNHTDACSTGNIEAGLVNAWGHTGIPNNLLKSRTPTGLYFSLNGKSLLQCEQGPCISSEGCNRFYVRKGRGTNF